MKTYYVDFKIVTMKVNGPLELFQLANSYFPGAVKDNEIRFDFEVNYNGINKSKPKIPQDAKLIQSFGGASYYTWQDNNNKTFSYCHDSYIYGGNIIENNGREFNIWVTDYDDNQKSGIIWAIRLIRELFLMAGILKNYIPIHASAVSIDNQGLIFFGEKGSGKTTSMFTLVNKLKAQPLSNDLVLVGKDEDNEWEILGWGWRVTVGNELLKASGFSERGENLQNNKTAFYPLDFSKYISIPWCWHSKLKAIIKTQIDLDKNITVENIERNNIFNKLLQEGTEQAWQFGDYLNMGIFIPNFKVAFDKISNDIPSYNVTGNIWASATDSTGLWNKILRGDM